eukprot:2284650-Rhodomonas_salina.1
MTAAQPRFQSKVMLYPRQKGSGSPPSSTLPTVAASALEGTIRQAVTLDRDSIALCFHMPIADAARHFNICVTSLKKVCRRLGYDKWPYVKPSKLNPSGNVAPKPTSSTRPEHAAPSPQVARVPVVAQSSPHTMAKFSFVTASDNSITNVAQFASFRPAVQQPAQFFQQPFSSTHSSAVFDSSQRSASEWNRTASAQYQVNFAQGAPVQFANPKQEYVGNPTYIPRPMQGYVKKPVHIAHPKQEHVGYQQRYDCGLEVADSRFMLDGVETRDDI